MFIERYSPAGPWQESDGLEKDKLGMLVFYDDHLEIVKQLQDKIEDLESDLTYARNN